MLVSAMRIVKIAILHGLPPPPVSRRGSNEWENRSMRCAIGMVILAATFALAACGGGESSTGSAPQVADTGMAASECPEANAALEKAGFPVPDEYAPACPTTKEVRRQIESTVETPPAALREALEEGVIHEGQDPKTYPPEVKQAID
jgi:hypothetical protein